MSTCFLQLADADVAPAQSGRKPEQRRSRAVIRPSSSTQNRCCSTSFQGSPGLFTPEPIEDMQSVANLVAPSMNKLELL